MKETPKYEDIRAALPQVREWLPETPLWDYPVLDKLFGCRLFLKHENHLPVGAFKVRGGVNFLSRLSDDQSRRGVIGVSTGNHGQSLAWSCNRLGVACTICVPRKSNPDKVRAIRSLGAKIIAEGDDFEAAKSHCEQLVKSSGAPLYVHSANEPHLIAGVGTYGLEVFERLPDPDVILVPVGLGSGICGMALVAKHLRPETQIVGVQATGAAAIARSWQTGEFVTTDTIETAAEGLATRVPAELTLGIIRDLVDDFVLVNEDEIEQAIRWILEATHNLAEGAGAAAFAAAYKIRSRLAGLKVVAVLSGGNQDIRKLPNILSRTAPLPSS